VDYAGDAHSYVGTSIAHSLRSARSILRSRVLGPHLCVQVEDEWRAKERAKRESGKETYYLKASEKKRLVLEKKFEKLEATGQLERYLAKRRKKTANKMHKKLPFRRTS
jgi:hypothetical protein